MFFAVIAFGLMGPTELLHLPDKLALIVTGIVIIGLSQSLLFVNSVPEIMDSFQLEYKIIVGYDKSFDNKLNDHIAGYSNVVYSLAALVFPIIGGILYD